MRRLRPIPILIAAGFLVSCGDGLEPPTTGSIALNIRLDQLQPATAPVLATIAPPDSASTRPATPMSDAGVHVELGVAAFTSAVARTIGPTAKTVNLQLVDNFWEGTLDGLAQGTYSVVVQGLVNGEISATGTATGVAVTVGNTTSADVSVTSFIPALTVGISSPTTSLVIPVTVSTVGGADSYKVEWANNPGFSAAGSKNVTGGSATINLADVGTYYIRARAIASGTNGAPSTAATVNVTGDVPNTGADAGTALTLGFGSGATQRLTQLNIAPADDQDWFAVDGCRFDTLTAEVFAKRLTPPSDLNSFLRVFPDGGPPIPELGSNDDLDGTQTDSRLQVVLPTDGRFLIQVTSSGGATAGAYELDLQLKNGPNNTGTSCVPLTVTVTPATQTIAAGATQQFTATAKDAGGTTITGIQYLWVSSNTNVAVVDTNGLATGVGGGTAAITAVGLGEPGSAALTVTGPAFGTPTALAFSAQPTSTTAGTGLSPAVEVEIRDANNKLLTSARNAVTLAIANNPGGSTLYGTKTVNANNGVARFTGLSLDKVGTGYTLSASATSLTGATSGAFNIAPGAPAKLSFGQQPTGNQGNVVITPAITVTISDAFNNVVTGATNAVTMNFGVNVWQFIAGTGGTLLGTKTVSAVNGTATFPSLRVDLPGSGYTLVASAAGLTPVTSNPFAINLTVQSVRAGRVGSHTCALTTGGTYCWGYGGDGQLGDGTGTFTSTNPVPRLVSGGITFTQVTTGSSHSCGLTAAGAAYCWGYNYYGQLGNNSTTNTDQPVAVSGNLTFSSISAGAYHTCGVVGNAAYCWGNDSYGQLGDDASLAGKKVPTLVAGGITWASVTPGAYHTCGLSTGGSTYCWGADWSGQLGDNAALTNQPTPVVVAGGKTWQNVSPAGDHTCAVDAAGAGYCWGTNYNGELGVDTTVVPRNATTGTPVAVTGSLTLSTIQTGWNHTCGLTTTGAAYCWGTNNDGELGDGSSAADSPLPVAVAGALTFNSLTAGGYHTCGRVGTAVWCWGSNYDGELGTGRVGNKNQPVQIVQ